MWTFRAGKCTIVVINVWVSDDIELRGKKYNAYRDEDLEAEVVGCGSECSFKTHVV